MTRVGAFHDAVEADDLCVGFYPGGFGECWQSCSKALEGDGLHDGGVVFEHGFDARVGGAAFAHGGAEFGLVVGEFVLDGGGERECRVLCAAWGGRVGEWAWWFAWEGREIDEDFIGWDGDECGVGFERLEEGGAGGGEGRSRH